MVSNTGKFSIIAYITSTTYFVILIICTLTLLTHSTPLTAGRVDPLPLPPQCATPPCSEPSPSNHHHGLSVVDPAPRHLSIASWVCRLGLLPSGRPLIAILGMASSSCRATCPAHLSLFDFTMSVIHGTPSSSLKGIGFIV